MFRDGAYERKSCALGVHQSAETGEKTDQGALSPPPIATLRSQHPSQPLHTLRTLSTKLVSLSPVTFSQALKLGRRLAS